MSYSPTEVKIVKQELSWGYTFTIILIGATLFFNWIYNVLEKNEYFSPKYPISMYVNLIMFIITVSIFFSLTRKPFRDLRDQERIIKYETLQFKLSEKTYAIAGKVGRMKESIRYDFIINNIKYEVNKDDFEKFEENEKIEIHYAKHTNVILGYKKTYKN